MMNRQLKRVLVLVVGWAFILVGIAGLFLPVLQGILCLLIGLTILSTEYVWAHRLLRKIKDRFPRIAALSDQAAERAQRWLERIRRRSKRPAGTESDSAQGTEPDSDEAKSQVEDR